MVFKDLSAPEAHPYKRPTNLIPIASVSDRFIAFILDFLIFSPVISLLTAGLMRQTKTFFMLNTGSSQGLLAAAMVCVSVFALVVLLQTVFLFHWQATPGQLFMQMRVESYPHSQGRLSLNQCLLRSLMWCTGFALLAVPFLEIASHPLRRAFHERASDTVVVTLKQNYDEGPHPLESRFIGSWLRMSFLFLLLIGVLGFFKTYYSLQAGFYKGESATENVCKEMKDTDLWGVARLDAALSLFLLNEITSECLNKEAEAFLWSDPVNSQELAYLAKFVAAEEAEQTNYYNKVCESPTQTCALARYLAEDGGVEDLEMADGKLWTVQLLQSDEKFSQKDYVGSLKLLSELQNKPSLKAAVEKRYVRGIWALRDQMGGDLQKGRRPASSDEERETLIETFKEKYEVP